MPGYRKNNVFSDVMPSQIHIESKVLDEKSSRCILKLIENEEFLPLEMKKSSISGAGNGVFATSDIPVGTNFLTYTGDVGPHYKIKNTNSLVDIGTMIQQERRQQDCKILLDGRNAGRLLNSHKDSEKINCEISLFFYRNK